MGTEIKGRPFVKKVGDRSRLVTTKTDECKELLVMEQAAGVDQVSKCDKNGL